jgi:hypothetical protein
MGFEQKAVKKSRKEKRAGQKKEECGILYSPLVLHTAAGDQSGVMKLLAQLTSAVVAPDSITKMYRVCVYWEAATSAALLT